MLCQPALPSLIIQINLDHIFVFFFQERFSSCLRIVPNHQTHGFGATHEDDFYDCKLQSFMFVSYLRHFQHFDSCCVHKIFTTSPKCKKKFVHCITDYVVAKIHFKFTALYCMCDHRLFITSIFNSLFEHIACYYSCHVNLSVFPSIIPS